VSTFDRSHANGHGNGGGPRVPDGPLTPPQNLEAEQSVLGAVLLSDTALPALIIDEGLHPEDFYREAHGLMFQAMLDLHSGGEPVDALTLAEHLKQTGRLEAAGGRAAVDLLAASVPAVGNLRQYARIVRDNAMLRRLLRASYEIQARVHAHDAPPRELVDIAERTILEVAHEDSRKDFRAVHDVLFAELDKLERLSQEGKAITGTPSGFDDLDTITGGFQPGNLIILAARPSMGKSALMANFAEHAALGAKKAVALFSLEMSESELAQRFIASQASIKGDDLRKGRVAASRWGKIMEASNRLANSPLFIDDSSDLSVLDVRAKARRLLQQHADGLGLILIDYLQLMRADGRTDSRVEQIGQISRGLKTLARELDVPVIALSQLNRGVEQRTDKRPVLSDLRESGCLAGDSRVYLPDAGEYRRIDSLVGMRNFRVTALNTATWKLEPCRVSNAFATGRKPVFALRTALGRRVRATANHRFLTVDGWRRLDALRPGMHIALPRRLDGPSAPTMTDAEVALLGLLIGDGCTLPRHAIQFTTHEPQLAQLASELATEVFGDAIAPVTRAERRWHQVYLRSRQRLTHGTRNPVAAWLGDLGVFGLRSHEKRVPDRMFAQSCSRIARFLRHLWATDGCVWHRDGRSAIYYATSSERLARDVQSLLLRLGVTATLGRIPQGEAGRDQFHVHVTGKPDMQRFLDVVRTVDGRRAVAASDSERHLRRVRPITNRDVVPAGVWDSQVKPAIARAGLTHRVFQARLGTAYCGSTLYRSNLGRERAARVAEIVESEQLHRLATSDVYWDQVVAIELDGEEEVYDLTVDRLHSFVADDVIVHNSIEQDADLVMFIYRDEYYDPESEREGIADVIISKHRNGGLGTVELTFQKDYPRFMSYVGDDRY
jgi:replicative DNA helicase